MKKACQFRWTEFECVVFETRYLGVIQLSRDCYRYSLVQYVLVLAFGIRVHLTCLAISFSVCSNPCILFDLRSKPQVAAASARDPHA